MTGVWFGRRICAWRLQTFGFNIQQRRWQGLGEMIYGIPTLKQRKAALPNGEEKMMGLNQAYPHIACRQMWSRAGPEGYKSSICVELGHHGSRLWLRHCHLVTHQCWASSRPTRGLFVLCWWLAMLVTGQTERVSLASLPSALRPALLFCYTRS